MYHYILRSPVCIPSTNWDDIQSYLHYTRYKSPKFEHLHDMVADYKREIKENYITPNPEFYYDGTLMRNSDDVYYGFDIIEEPLSQEIYIQTESELLLDA